MKKWYERLAIILPTYNESKNLRILLTKIYNEVPGACVIIVDDSNPSENIKIKRIVKLYTNVEILTRQKKLGRGSAVLHGFEHALRNKKIRYFVEMDTDLAHDPHELHMLQKKMHAENAQLVIGSRYMTKSKIVDWPLRRLVMSKLINLFLNLWLGLKLHDYTNGYRMYTSNAVEHLVRTGLHEKNFITLSESAFLLKKKNMRIIEVPITFTDRKHGISSVGFNELFVSLMGAFRIKLRYNYAFSQKKSWFLLSKTQALILVMIIAVGLRLWNLNMMGKTWDEPAYVEQGYHLIQAVKTGDWDNKLLYHSDHPPLARYLYGIAEHVQIGEPKNNQVIFPYEYTFPRLVSLFFSVMSIFLIFFFGWRYVSPFVGFVSAMILAMLPFFLGFSQLATLESLNMFFFTASVYCFVNLLHKYSKKWILLTGVSIGLALLVKQSNIIILPLLFLLYIFWKFYTKKSYSWIKNKYLLSLISITIVAFLTFAFLWPMLFFNLREVWSVQDTMWIKNASLPPPEVFFGKLMLVPLPYYGVFFLITTPMVILLFFFLGLLRIDRLKKWLLYTIVLWFIFSFLQSLYPFKQHGIRYIIQIYAPMTIIAAIGFEFLINSLTTKKWVKITAVFLLFFYQFIILSKATPYYLDYFNVVAGGTNGVYEKKLFQLGWWGQGLREAGIYLEKNAEKGSSIGLAVNPIHSFPLLEHYFVSSYDANVEYDYVVVSYFAVLRERFDDRVIKNKYRLIYCVNADKACIISIYKKKPSA